MALRHRRDGRDLRENLTGTMEEKLAALNEAWDYALALDEGFCTILISAILAGLIALLVR